MGNQVRKCAIIGSAPVQGGAALKEYAGSAFVICADGGVDTALRYGIKPDLIIGDFDSLQGPLPQGVEVVRLKPEKDETDIHAAIREGIRRGCTDFALLGATGGRLDHSFANFCLLQYLVSQGCRAVLADESSRIFLMPGGRLNLTKMIGSIVSVFPFGGAMCTVSYEGMKYPLSEHPLYSDNPLGVSNEIVSDAAQIVVHTGNALVFVLSEAT